MDEVETWLLAMIPLSNSKTPTLYQTLIFSKNHVNKKNSNQIEKQSLMS